MKLLCTGDLHLGAGAQYPGRLDDQRAVWTRILDLAQERQVDGILFAGDVFEGPTPTSEHYDAFLRPIVGRPIRAPQLLAISGNGRHDSAMRTPNALQVCARQDLQVLARPDIVKFAGCAIACLPWVSPARLVARLGRDVSRDDVNERLADLVIDIAASLKDDCERVFPGLPHILLAHWSVSGAALPTGLPVDQLREPVLDGVELEGIGFDREVLGHIHRAQTVGPRGFYVGSPLPLNFGEGDLDHGVWIFENTLEAPEFVPIESRRFVTLDLDVDDLADEVAHTFEDVEQAIVRVRYTATRDQQHRFDIANLRKVLLAAGAHVVMVQPTIIREERARVQGLDETASELDTFDQWTVAYGLEPATAARMRNQLVRYLETV